MSKTALYARVSTSGKGQDPETQLIQLREYASRMGYEVEEFTDTISGSESDRPGLNLLKDAIFRGEVERVVVWDLSRLGRSLRDLIDLVQYFDDNRVELIIIQLRIDTSRPQDRLFLHIMGALAEFEREMIRDRINIGIARARAQGKHIGRKPKKLHVDWIRELKAEGLPVRTITERYNDRLRTVLLEAGIKDGSPRWDRRWKAESASNGTIHRALNRMAGE